MKAPIILLFTLPVILAAACTFDINFNTPPTDTAGPAVPTATATSPFPWPDEAGTCKMVTTGTVTLYDRPSTEAQVFSEVGADFSAVVTGRTVDGWVGFDPGVAQAANIGVFRLRWAFFDDVSLSGDCVSVPQLGWVPAPDLCYTMPMDSVNVYSGADTSSSILATLNPEDFASVGGYTGDGWAQVDLGAGNTGPTGIGWMQQADLNVNGGTCDELPAVSP